MTAVVAITFYGEISRVSNFEHSLLLLSFGRAHVPRCLVLPLSSTIAWCGWHLGPHLAAESGELISLSTGVFGTQEESRQTVNGISRETFFFSINNSMSTKLNDDLALDVAVPTHATSGHILQMSTSYLSRLSTAPSTSHKTFQW